MVADDRADVIVVGAGPAGASTATHLARAGLEVLVFDRARFPREKACAEYCSPGVVEALDDLGALDRIRSCEHTNLETMRIHSASEEIPLDFDSDSTSRQIAMGIKRSVLDQELFAFAQDSGARVMQGYRVTAPAMADGRVTGVWVRNGATEQEVRSEFVVAADGLNSTISRAMSNDRPVRWPRRLGLVSRYRTDRAIEGVGQMHVEDGIYCGLSPVAGNEINVSLVVPMNSKPQGMPTAEFFERSLTRLPGISRVLNGATRVSKVRGMGPLGKRVRAVSGNGFLLVGDAAGFFDPLTGEGIHRALRGGELAATGTLAALDRDDRYPEGYKRARIEAFGDKERVCQIIQLLLEFPRLRNYSARRAASRDGVRRELRGVLGDYEPAGRALRPGFLWSLFRP